MELKHAEFNEQTPGKKIMKSIQLISTIDTHTCGAPTRVITGGLSPLHGETITEKMRHFQVFHDNLRKCLLSEPRGHRDMAGAILTDSKQMGANLGIMFLTHSGYQDMCVTSTMGAITVAIETGMLQMNQEGQQSIGIETAAGLIQATLQIQSGDLKEISLLTAPAFTLLKNFEMAGIYSEPLHLDVAYSGIFFVLLDASQIGLSVTPANFEPLYSLGLNVLKQANQSIQVAHPLFPKVQSIEMIMIYEGLEPSHFRNMVINRSGGVDRSPCGAGSGALISTLQSKEEINAGQIIKIESYIGTRFNGRFYNTCDVGRHPGIIPEISGRAHITGLHQFILEADDPFPNGLNI